VLISIYESSVIWNWNCETGRNNCWTRLELGIGPKGVTSSLLVDLISIRDSTKSETEPIPTVVLWC